MFLIRSASFHQQKGERSMLQSNMDVSLESLVNSLQSTRSTLLSEIEMLNDTEVNVKPRRDKWSIIQILHHLHLVEQSVTSALVYALQKNERNTTPFKDLQLTLDRTHKREAPQQMKPTETLMKTARNPITRTFTTRIITCAS